MGNWEHEGSVKVKLAGIFEIKPEFFELPIQDESGDIAGFKKVFSQNHLIFTGHGKNEIQFRLTDYPPDKVAMFTSGLAELCTKYCGFLNQIKSNELYDTIKKSISIFSDALEEIKNLQKKSNMTEYITSVAGPRNEGLKAENCIDVPLYLKSVSGFPDAARNTKESLQSFIEILNDLQPEKKHRGPNKKYGNFEQAVAELFTKMFGKIPTKTGKNGIDEILGVCFEGLGIKIDDMGRRLKTIDNKRLKNILENNK